MIDSEIKKIANSSSEEPQVTREACGSFASEENVRFRPMSTADLDEVMVIERTSFRFPWSTGFFLQELQIACARSILAEVDNKIVGYVLFWLLPGMADVHNIAIQLLTRVLLAARQQSLTRVTLEVRKSNSPAQKLYESLGFVTSGLRKGYYSDDGEDALAMTLELAT